MSGAELFSVSDVALPGFFWTGVQASLLVLLAGIGALALRQGPAAGRHALWAVALAGIVLLPVLPSVSPFEVAAPVSAERVVSGALAALAPAAGDADDAAPAAAPVANGDFVRTPADVEDAILPVGEPELPAAVQGEEGAVAAVRGARATSGAKGPLAWVALAWMVGLGLMVGRFLLGGLILRAMTRRGQAPTGRIRGIADRIRSSLGVRRPVRILVHDRVTSPMTWGIVRPAVLLPTAALGWDEDRLHVVFAHELAHIARLDVLTRGIAAAARAIHWFNPLVWWAAARMIAEAERACDDCVLRQGARPSDYAGHLLALASGPVRRSMATAAASPMAQRSGFEGRILAILASGPRGRFGGIPGISLVGLSALTVLLVGSVVPGSAATSGPVAAPVRVAEPAMDEDVTAPEAAPEEVAPQEVATPPEAAPPQEADTQEVTSQEVTTQEVTTLDRMIRALGDEDREVRAAMVQALARQEDPRAVRALMEALRTDVDAGVRESAAWALGQLEDAAAIPALVEAVRGDDVVEVRRTAIWALGQIESEEAVPGLGEALDDPDEQVRETALWALGQIESPEAVPYLQTALTDTSAEVRRNATWALGQIEAEEAVPALAQALSDEDVGVRRSAAWALGQIESPDAVDALQGALSDPDPETRATAAWALGQIEPRQAPPGLIEALGDDDQSVRETALWALSQIEDPGSVAPLMALLDGEHPESRMGALYALGQIRTEEAVAAIATLLDDPDPEVKRAAARALAGRGGWSGPRPRPRPQPRPRPRPRPWPNLHGDAGPWSVGVGSSGSSVRPGGHGGAS